MPDVAQPEPPPPPRAARPERPARQGESASFHPYLPASPSHQSGISEGSSTSNHPAPSGGPSEEQRARQRAQQATNQAVARFLRAERPAAILIPSGWTYGILRTGGHPDGRTARDSSYDPIPALLVGHEHYGQMWRNSKRGVPVKLELNVQNRFVDGDRMERNASGKTRSK